MTQPILHGFVRKGWKVFLGSDQVGVVEDVDQHELTVKRGGLLKQTVAIPVHLVAEADEGIVDLRDEPSTHELLKVN